MNSVFFCDERYGAKCSCILAFFTLKWNWRPNRKEHGGINSRGALELTSTPGTLAMIPCDPHDVASDTFARTTRPRTNGSAARTPPL